MLKIERTRCRRRLYALRVSRRPITRQQFLSRKIAKSGQISTDDISIITANIDKKKRLRFLNTLSTTLFLVMLIYPDLDVNFLFWVLFVIFPRLSTFNPLLPNSKKCNVSNFRVVRNDLKFSRYPANFSAIVTFQITFYLWLL